MTPEEFLNTVNSYTNSSKQNAKKLFPTVASKFEELLYNKHTNHNVSNPCITLGAKQFGTNNVYTIMALTDLLEDYIVKKGWLVSVQRPENYGSDVDTFFRLYKPSFQNKIIVWFQNTFNSTYSLWY